MKSLLRLPTAALAAALLYCAAPAVQSASFSFAGNLGSGIIPDNAPAGLPITFTASGLSQPVYTVSLSLTLTHAWAGDLDVVLTSPDGRARLVVFSRIGGRRSSTNGDSSNFGGQYVFSDFGGDDVWAAAATAPASADTVATGTYRTSSAGAPSRSDNGGCPTSLTGVFGGLSPAQANGVWTLTIADRAAGDTGAVQAATLRIDDSIPLLHSDGFEATGVARATAKGVVAVSRCSNKIQADFNGDGLSDYVLVRATAGDYQWIVRYNLGNGTATPEAEAITFSHGGSPAGTVDAIDFDGDRIADATVWDDAGATFSVRRSSRTLDPVVEIPFGLPGDDPTQSGDYDGDGRDDLGVFRAPDIAGPDGPLRILVRGSDDGAESSVFVGVGVEGDAFATAGYDFNGDGLADISIQRPDLANPSNGRFMLFDGRSGSVIDDFDLGLASDFIIPGNFVGNPQFDTTVRRTVSGVRRYQSRDSQTGLIAPEANFGVTGDSSIGGDYDGDGLSDLAVWRGSATPGASKFLVRRSVDTTMIWEITGGMAPTPSTSDFPVAGSRVR